jgi:hypothetical protein
MSIVLGHCGPRPRDDSGPRHRVLYLPAAHLIVTVECRTYDGWRCTVIAGQGRDYRPGHLTLTNGDIAHADTTLVADPIGDPAPYALLWQTRVRQRWLGAHLRTVARVIAEHLRPPGTLAVDIDRHAATQLVTAARLRGAHDGLVGGRDRIAGAPPARLATSAPGQRRRTEAGWSLFPAYRYRFQ